VKLQRQLFQLDGLAHQQCVGQAVFSQQKM
jgi:hypothetical protein